MTIKEELVQRSREAQERRNKDFDRAVSAYVENVLNICRERANDGKTFADIGCNCGRNIFAAAISRLTLNGLKCETYVNRCDVLHVIIHW